MTIKLVALVLLCLMTGTAVAEEPKVTSLMSKDLPENPGPVAELVGIKVGVVSGVINLESSGVEASDWRLRHEATYHEA
jgi:hypothetical protein